MTYGLQALDTDEMYTDIVFRGGKLRADLSEAITDANISLDMGAVSQLSITVDDPGLNIFNDGYIRIGTLVDYQDLRFQVAVVETGGGTSGTGSFTVTCRPDSVQKIKARTGPMVLKNLSPSEFIAHECAAAAVPFFCQPSAKRKQIARDVLASGEEAGNEKPSSWTTFSRLASELGYKLWETGGVIYFAKPSYMMKVENSKGDLARYFLAYWGVAETAKGDFNTRGVPVCRQSIDSDDGIEVSFEVDILRSVDARPGRVVRLRGMPVFHGDYILTKASFPLAGPGVVQITANQPIDPVPQPPDTTTTSSGTVSTTSRSIGSSNTRSSTPDTSGHRDKGSSRDFVYQALRQSGDRYVFGAEARKSDSNPDVFDCSELVEWAAAQVGVYIPDGSGNQRSYCWGRGGRLSTEAAIRTPGALLFANGHVAISLGNGKTIEAVNRSYGVRVMNARGRSSVSWLGGGKIPGMRY